LRLGAAPRIRTKSGDSDFERRVDLLRSRGKRIYVMTSDGQLSRELSHPSDKSIFFIEDYVPN
jgi:uncharacterized LabA/DUF88 family protein